MLRQQANARIYCTKYATSLFMEAKQSSHQISYRDERRNTLGDLKEANAHCVKPALGSPPPAGSRSLVLSGRRFLGARSAPCDGLCLRGGVVFNFERGQVWRTGHLYVRFQYVKRRISCIVL